MTNRNYEFLTIQNIYLASQAIGRLPHRFCNGILRREYFLLKFFSNALSKVHHYLIFRNAHRLGPAVTQFGFIKLGFLTSFKRNLTVSLTLKKRNCFYV